VQKLQATLEQMEEAWERLTLEEGKLSDQALSLRIENEKMDLADAVEAVLDQLKKAIAQYV
jgi:gamma-glutamylcysteine synthetase